MTDRQVHDESGKWLRLIKRRTVVASGYALQGLKACFTHEEAFRVEVIGSLVLLPVAMLIAESAVEGVLLTGSMLLVLIVELLNSAIEAAVDRMGEEKHELAGRAKDLGAAAVMLAVALFFITWISISLF